MTHTQATCTSVTVRTFASGLSVRMSMVAMWGGRQAMTHTQATCTSDTVRTFASGLSVRMSMVAMWGGWYRQSS
jgi:hypothetical protein